MGIMRFLVTEYCRWHILFVFTTVNIVPVISPARSPHKYPIIPYIGINTRRNIILIIAEIILYMHVFFVSPKPLIMPDKVIST